MAAVEKEMYKDEERVTLCIFLSGFFCFPVTSGLLNFSASFVYSLFI